MADSLRDRLVEAKLAGRKTYPTDVVTSHGYEFRSNEGAADAALPVIADWLRAEAQLQEDEHRYPWGGLDHETSYIVEDLRRLARSITESTDGGD